MQTQTITSPPATEPPSQPPKKSWLLSPPILAVLIFALINVVILFSLPVQKRELTRESVFNSANESMQKGPWSWWISRAFFNNKHDIILMGDSQMNAAIFQADAHVLKRSVDTVLDHQAVSVEERMKEKNLAGLHVLNLSTPGSFVSDQYMLSEALFHLDPPKLVVLGLGPRLLIDCTLPSPSSTEPFKFFSPYVDLTSVSDITFDGFFDKMSWVIEKHLPMWGLRDKAYGLLDQLSAKIFARAPVKAVPQKVKTPEAAALQAITSGGDLRRGEAIIPDFKNYSYADNSKEYLHRYRVFLPEEYIAQLTFLNRYLCSLHGMGVRVLVVGMPSLPAHRKLLHPQFWKQYKQIMAQTCAKDGAEWHDLTDDTRFVQRDYLDNVHLNQDGGIRLVNILTDWIMTLPSTNAPKKAAP